MSKCGLLSVLAGRWIRQSSENSVVLGGRVEELDAGKYLTRRGTGGSCRNIQEKVRSLGFGLLGRPL